MVIDSIVLTVHSAPLGRFRWICQCCHVCIVFYPGPFKVTNKELCRYLLSKGANPNLADSKGITPLDLAKDANQGIQKAFNLGKWSRLDTHWTI